MPPIKQQHRRLSSQYGSWCAQPADPDPYSTENRKPLGLHALNINDSDASEKNDKELDDAPSTYLSRFYYGTRTLLAAIGGFIDGLITAPLVGIERLVHLDKIFKPRTPAKTIARIPWDILKTMARQPFRSAKKWLAFEKKQQHHLRKKKSDSEASPSERGYLSLGLYGIAGFIFGCIKAPFASLEACFKIPPQETFIASVLKAPFRFAYELFVGPIQTAQNWALNIVEKRENNDYDFPIKENKSHYKIRSFIGYIRVGFNTVSGFILGCIKAPFEAINTVLNSPTEPLLYSALMAIPRFLNALFTIPFSTAEEWLENSKDQLDEEVEKEKRANNSYSESTRNLQNTPRPISVMDYLRIGLSIVIGFIVGCIVAPIIALDELILKRKPSTTESLVESLILTPFRFLDLLMRIPFLIATDRGTTEKALIESAEEAPARVVISGFNNYVCAFFKGFFGFIVGLIAAPIKGIINFFSVPSSKDEFSLITLVKIPVCYLETLLFFPFMLAYNWAKPVTQKKHNSIADEPKAKENNNQQIHNQFGSNDPKYTAPDKASKKRHRRQEKVFHLNPPASEKNEPPSASTPGSQLLQKSFS